MAEYASAVLALALFAIDTSKSLYQAVIKIKSQKKEIKDLRSDLTSLVSVLESIQVQAKTTRDASRLESLRHPLNCCLQACQEMHDMLKACTAHSKEGQFSVRDWLSMQYKEKSFEEIKNRIASFKSILSISLASILIADGSIVQLSLEELNESIEGTREDLQIMLEQLEERISKSNESAKKTLEADCDQIKESLRSLVQAEKIVKTITIEENKAGAGSRAVFGTDTSRPQFNLNVSRNEAGVGAIMSAGVHTPETLQALLAANLQAPPLTLMVEELNNQSSGTNLEALLSLVSNSGAANNINQIEVNDLIITRNL
ncbi:hypothetical protein N7495_000717 [Penicillium taxi]|uniref:uncharacterized protein n=1 Tax=Penicillium taxi TaxID=168475 RepID=UPI0025454B33|nr:uncharacterized protein N7495_000717 [Penicillium taxi]KAJ5908035.1 hypothetical protein N7495_000717 [Penicillium taxi]